MSSVTAQNKGAASDAPQHRRRRHYIDASVQGRLLIAMVVLEVFLFSGAMLWLYYDLSAVVEAHLYRVHITEQHGVSPLLKAFFYIVPTLILVNAVALAVGDRIWRRYVSRIVVELQKILERIGQLDLREVSVEPGVEHEVLDKAGQWHAYERQRYQAIQQVVNDLPDTLDTADPVARGEAEKAFEHLHRLLK